MLNKCCSCTDHARQFVNAKFYCRKQYLKAVPDSGSAHGQSRRPRVSGGATCNPGGSAGEAGVENVQKGGKRDPADVLGLTEAAWSCDGASGC